MAEGRVTEVVGQRGGLGEVGVAAQRTGQVTRDLGHLEAVGEPVADEVIALWPHDLGLGRQPARGRRVHDAGTIALEGSALGGIDPFRRFGDEPLTVGVVVALQEMPSGRP